MALAWASLGALQACDEAAIVARPIIEVEPQEISFGKVPTGQSRTVELRVRNRAANGTLTLEEAQIAEGSAPVFTLAPPERTTVEPSEELILRVSYSPDDAEPDAGEVILRSNAEGGADLRIPLSSERTFAKIKVSPAQLELGAITMGEQRAADLSIESTGDATLVIHRLSLRSAGFAGEVCSVDSDCQEGRCLPSSTGAICAVACDAGCAAGYECQPAQGGTACLETAGTQPPIALRGFSFMGQPESLLPQARAELTVVYAPSSADRGSAQLIIESNDQDRPLIAVPLIGRPENLPPIAQAQPDGALPDPILPGVMIGLSSAGSVDPEGESLTYRWRFIRRPEGSNARFVDPVAENTSFMVDRPGVYIAGLEVRDETGLASTNDARVELEAQAGDRFRAVLRWDQPGTDIDLHLLRPGALEGSLGDCYFDNPSPDWGPQGAQGDPSFSAEASRETIELIDPEAGVYTLLATVVSASPQGASAATMDLMLGEVVVATYEVTLSLGDQAWDIATLSWPQGLITELSTVR